MRTVVKLYDVDWSVEHHPEITEANDITGVTADQDIVELSGFLDQTFLDELAHCVIKQNVASEFTLAMTAAEAKSGGYDGTMD